MMFPQTEASAAEGTIAAPVTLDLLTLVQTTGTLEGVDNFNIDFRLPKFDPALGKLNKLTITLIGNATSRIRFTNASKLFTPAGEAYLDEQITVLVQTDLRRMGPLLTMNCLTELGIMAVAPESKRTATTSEFLSASKVLTNSSVLSCFTGVGSVRGKLKGAKFFCSDFPDRSASAVMVNAKLSITYSYYPSVVYKPADRG
jgi:hypothetical protein